MIRGFLLGITVGVCALAQTPTSHFEVASIKPVSTDVPMRASADPDRLILSRVGMIDLLMQALYVDRDQVAAPEWINAETYEITANRPPGSTKEQQRQMMLNLLKERFGLTFHWETRVVSAYELVQDKGGAKLDAPFKDLPGYPAAEYGPMIRRAKGEDSLLRLTCSECTLPFIRRELLRQFAPVVDKTGLTGKYNFHLEYAPDDLMGAMRQVGLRLIRAKLPLEFVVIDHLERQPTEN